MQRSVFQMFGIVLGSYVLAACPPPAPNAQRSNPTTTTSSGHSRPSEPSGGTIATPTRSGNFTGRVEAPQGVTVSAARCSREQAESCNGLDDDCNGLIDDNCGYLGGAIQVTASWRGAPDIDLRVTDPTGEEVYFGHRQSASGAQMDMDANGECTVTRPTAENVRWTSQSPPAGRYDIKLIAFDLCGATDATATLSIAVGGRVVGAWTVPFTYGRQEYVFPLTIE